MKVHLIDGNSYAYRAFYGLPRLSNGKGQATQAVYGVAMFLLRLLKDRNVTDVVVAFDPPGPTFRHKEFAQYKAQRKPTPDDLISQFPLIHELVRALGIQCVQREGYEADDVIATITRRARESGGEVVIYSGDKDILQLVGKGVKVKIPRRENEEVDSAGVEKRWGVPPERMVDLLGLMGDSSDNLPGVRGIGEKTAGALLKQFGTLDAVFERLGEVKSPRLREKLAAERGEAMRTRELAELRDRLPLSPEEERTSLVPPDIPRLKELFAELEFSSLLSSLPAEGRGETERPAGLCPRLLPRPDSELIASLAGPGEIFCIPLGDHLALETDRGRWLVAASPETARDLGAFLADARPRKVTFGLKDLARLACAGGVRMDGAKFDVQLAGYLAGGRAASLEELARTHLGPGDMPEGTEARAGWALDCLKSMAPALAETARREGLENLLRDVEMPLAPVLAEMESRGILLDAGKLAGVTGKIRGRLGSLEREIMKAVGSEFNLLSPRQVGEVLFKKLSLPAKRKTKTGYSTNESVLEELAPLHPAPAKILEYRKLAKLLSTYLEPLPGFRGPDGLLRTRFNQMGAATGRLSSSEPNLQNIPIRGEIGQQIRSAFVPRSRDLALLSADYSQVELRILAHVSRDRAFLESFSANEDIHSATASEMFGKAVKEVSPDERRAAKAVNFGIIYGMTSFGLARELKCPPRIAAEYLDRYFSLHPAVRSYWDKTLGQARENGYVSTLMGRRRRLPEISSSVKARREEAEREALNHPIQGTAADIMKLAMVRCAREVPEARLLLSIHDELLFEVPKGKSRELAEKVRRAMEGVMDLAVPLVVEVAHGSSWAECHP